MIIECPRGDSLKTEKPGIGLDSCEMSDGEVLGDGY